MTAVIPEAVRKEIFLDCLEPMIRRESKRFQQRRELYDAGILARFDNFDEVEVLKDFMTASNTLDQFLPLFEMVDEILLKKRGPDRLATRFHKIERIKLEHYEHCTYGTGVFYHNGAPERFIEALQEAGFSLGKPTLEGSAPDPEAVRGVNAPRILELRHKDRVVEHFFVKGFAEKGKIGNLFYFSDILQQLGIDIVPSETLMVSDSRKYAYCIYEPQYNVEEMILRGEFSEEIDFDVLDSLVNLNVRGLGLQKGIDDFLERLRQDIMEGEKRIAAITEDLQEPKDEFEHLLVRDHPVKDMISGDFNYVTEFKRRIARLRIDPETSRFTQYFISAYIRPMMEGERVLSHNDFHIGNVFASGKILDIECITYGALGDDLAKYLISRYTHPGRFGGLNSRKIISTDNRKIRHYAERYSAASGNAVDSNEFLNRFEKILVQSALTTAMQRTKDYGMFGDEHYKQVAYGNFSIFYSSLDDWERAAFDTEFKDSKLGGLIETYKEREKAA